MAGGGWWWPGRCMQMGVSELGTMGDLLCCAGGAMCSVQYTGNGHNVQRFQRMAFSLLKVSTSDFTIRNQLGHYASGGLLQAL